MRGFKAFNKDMTCRGFQYEIGHTYEFDGEPIPCKQGFHFCETIVDCYGYYPMNDTTRICEIEANGDIETSDKVKYCTNKITIIREVTEESILKVNTGHRNTGYRNTGDYNAGDYNAGKYNTGNYNTGNYNVGNYNAGSWNTGGWNTGGWNTGNANTGNRNIGNANTGCFNKGSWNTGDYNVGDCNTGYFNTKKEKIRMFDGETDWTRDDWIISGARYFLSRVPNKIVEWVSETYMTDEEKEQNPSYKTTGGYLKVLDESEAKQAYWDSLLESEKQQIYNLPNFDENIFKECTGIDVTRK